MLTKKDKKEILQVAGEFRRKYRAKGEFRQADYKAALGAKLARFRKQAMDGLTEWAAEAIDERSGRDKGKKQSWMVPLFDEGGEYRLGAGRRIAKSLATLKHCDEALAIDDANLVNVKAANDRKHEELKKLRPYFASGSTTKREAAASWRKRHPSAEAH